MTIAPASERQTARAILDDLARDHTPALCRGDASSGNIISSRSGRWVCIDPRGVSGEYAYDAAVVAIRIASMIGGSASVEQIAYLSGVPMGRLFSWISIAMAARV
jgi:streptomycin 6-kinase